MQKSCAKTGGGAGDAPLDLINPDDMTAAQASNFMAGGVGSLMYRPSQPPFNVTTTKKDRMVGSFPFF